MTLELLLSKLEWYIRIYRNNREVISAIRKADMPTNLLKHEVLDIWASVDTDIGGQVCQEWVAVEID